MTFELAYTQNGHKLKRPRVMVTCEQTAPCQRRNY